MTLSRRAFVAACAAAGVRPATGVRPARAQGAGPRVVSLDWATTSTLLALGRPPVGAAEPGQYRRWVAEPALPPEVRDVGLRGQPSAEWTAALDPDLILIGPLTEPARPVLERIAPVVRYDLFTPARRPLAAAQDMTRQLGARLGCGPSVDTLLGRAEEAFEAARAALAPRGGRVLVVQVLDERHLNVFGAGSLFSDVLARVGVANAWEGETSIWGTSRIGVEALAAHPEADLVLVEPVPPAAGEAMARPGLWASLAKLRTGRTVTLPATWAYGDVTAAARFARLLAGALGPQPDAG